MVLPPPTHEIYSHYTASNKYKSAETNEHTQHVGYVTLRCCASEKWRGCWHTHADVL